jgi:antitoxin component YwqK of YwqJK toxin-antitoxin module
MKKIVIYFFNILLTYFLFAQEIPLSKAFVHQDNLNKSNIYISTFDTVFYNLKNGVIDGNFTYSDIKNLKITGEYRYSHPYGKWIFSAQDSKIKINFIDPGIIKFSKVKDITNKVFAGFGKIDIRYPIIGSNYSDTLISTLPIKWGKINGEVREMYSDSTLRAIYNYKNGKYHGTQIYYIGNGNRWEIEYKNGKPISNKTYYNTRGDELRKIKLAEIDKKSDFITYYDPADVIYNVKLLITLDSSYRQYPLLMNNVIDTINKLYYFRKIITYKDYNLQKEDWGAHDRPNIWDVSTDTVINKNNIIGIALVGNLIILHQDFQYRLQPLAASYVIKYDYKNEQHFYTSPWFYIPELMQRNLILPYGSILFFPYKITNLPLDNALSDEVIIDHSQVLILLEYINFLKDLFILK